MRIVSAHAECVVALMVIATTCTVFLGGCEEVSADKSVPVGPQSVGCTAVQGKDSISKSRGISGPESPPDSCCALPAKCRFSTDIGVEIDACRNGREIPDGAEKPIEEKKAEVADQIKWDFFVSNCADPMQRGNTYTIEIKAWYRSEETHWERIEEVCLNCAAGPSNSYCSPYVSTNAQGVASFQWTVPSDWPTQRKTSVFGFTLAPEPKASRGKVVQVNP